MTTIITVLYSVILGTLIKNLFHTDYNVTNNGITVNLLITKDTKNIVIGIFILFLIDWITFLLVFNPKGDPALSIREILLFLFFLPSITSLSFAVIFSLNTGCEKFCFALSFYYLLSTIGEVAWIGFTANSKSDALEIKQMISIFFICFMYLLIKGAWFVIFLLRHKKQSKVDPVFLTYLSFIFKPALILFLLNFTDVIKIIQ